MTDKEKIILSVAGSLATITIGYLIWRHEQTVQTANNAAQDAANAAAEQQLEQTLENTATTESTGASTLVGGGASGESFDNGSASGIEPGGGSDSNIAAILEAFFPNGAAPSSSNGNPPTTTVPIDPPNPTGGNPPVQAPPIPSVPRPVASVPGPVTGTATPQPIINVNGGPSKRFTGTAE